VAFHNYNIGDDEDYGKFGGVNSAILSASKLQFSRSSRFSISPENSRSFSEGYTTEKIALAHFTGQVPVYWGDPLDTPRLEP